MNGESWVVPARMPPANTRSSSGCSANHCQTERPWTRGNAAFPVRTVSVRSAQAAELDFDAK